MAQLNAQGAKGFHLLTSSYDESSDTQYLIYVKNANTTYTYERLTPAGNVSDFTAQLNAQGARGFKMLLKDFGLYYRDNAADTTYSYVVSQPTARTAESLLIEAKAQGANGYYARTIEERVGSTVIRIFEKDNKSSAQFTYALLDRAAGEEAFLAQANAQGANGYRYRFSDVTKWVYEKDAAQSSTFVFQYRKGAVGSVTTLVQQANEEGSKGNGYVEGLSDAVLYFKPSNCTGLLCDASSVETN